MRLKIKSFGESAEGIALSGDPRKNEPAHVRITFPGGDVEVVRATDGDDPDYWIHLRVNRPEDGHFAPGEEMLARLTDARLDIHGKDTKDAQVGDFNNKGLYHMAVRVRPDWKGDRKP